MIPSRLRRLGAGMRQLTWGEMLSGMMTRQKALTLAIVALDEVAKRHSSEGIINEWYVARRTIKAMLDKCERQIESSLVNNSEAELSQE